MIGPLSRSRAESAPAPVALTAPAVMAAPIAAPPRVAVLANQDDPESLALARHYVERRGLPESAIVALPMSRVEQITWPEFVATIWNPLVRAGIERGWLFASLTPEHDPVGRVRIVSSGHRLDALVICRGVPLRIAHDPALLDAIPHPVEAARLALFRTTEAAVDSELTLLATSGEPILAFVPNPLFGPERATEFLEEQILPVGRLDGPTFADARGLVDRAVEAERRGLAGRAYVDIGGDPAVLGHDGAAAGNGWFEETVKDLVSLGFETDVDRVIPTFGATARFDAPVLYFGWYASELNGPFATGGFRFPVGAVALHIYSFSAASLRSERAGWTAGLVARGVTATVGNVAEPYLGLTHQPHLLLRALARGEPLGRAALRSTRALSWMSIVVGDPLYRPFAVSAEEQWARRGELPPLEENYARIRRMRLLAAAGRGEEALEIGRAGLRQNPSLPLALSLASMQLSAGDAAGARRSLAVFSLLPKWRAADLPLVLEATRTLSAAEDSPEALKLLRRLLDQGPPDELRITALRVGVETARAAYDFAQAGRWETELNRLVAPAAAVAAP